MAFPYRAVFWCVLFTALAAPPGRAAAVLTLDEALRRALERNAGLKAALLSRESARALARQARALPNPALEAETENLGSGETSVLISQTLELGGKRAARAAQAENAAATGALAHEAARLALKTEVRTRFLDAFECQARLDLMDSTIALAESVLVHVRRRVASGANPEADALRSQNALLLARVEKYKAEKDFRAKKAALASLWQGGEDEFTRVAAAAEGGFPVPPFSAARRALDKSPALRSRALFLESRNIALRQARSGRVPDLAVGGGYRGSAGEGTHMAVVSLSVDVPFFDRKQGGIQASVKAREAVEKEAADAGARLLAELAGLYAGLEGLTHERQVLENEIIPNAAGALGQTRMLYDAGRTGYRDLADAYESLTAWKVRGIEARVSLLKIQAEIQERTGLVPGEAD